MLVLILFILNVCDTVISFCVISLHSFVDFMFSVDVACNANASDVCEIKFTYLLTYLMQFNGKVEIRPPLSRKPLNRW